MPERTWDFPIVTSLRKTIRARTSGEFPAMKPEHPLMGLINDVRRLMKRTVFGGRGKWV